MNEVEWETYLNLADFFLSKPEYQLDGIIYESVSKLYIFKTIFGPKIRVQKREKTLRRYGPVHQFVPTEYENDVAPTKN